MKTINGVDEHITGHCVIVFLYPALRIDSSIHFLQLMEHIECISLHNQFSLEKWSGKAEVP